MLICICIIESIANRKSGTSCEVRNLKQNKLVGIGTTRQVVFIKKLILLSKKLILLSKGGDIRVSEFCEGWRGLVRACELRISY